MKAEKTLFPDNVLPTKEGNNPCDNMVMDAQEEEDDLGSKMAKNALTEAE